MTTPLWERRQRRCPGKSRGRWKEGGGGEWVPRVFLSLCKALSWQRPRPAPAPAWLSPLGNGGGKGGSSGSISQECTRIYSEQTPMFTFTSTSTQLLPSLFLGSPHPWEDRCVGDRESAPRACEDQGGLVYEGGVGQCWFARSVWGTLSVPSRPEPMSWETHLPLKTVRQAHGGDDGGLRSGCEGLCVRPHSSPSPGAAAGCGSPPLKNTRCIVGASPSHTQTL